jgi:hypothetical protein
MSPWRLYPKSEVLRVAELYGIDLSGMTVSEIVSKDTLTEEAIAGALRLMATIPLPEADVVIRTAIVKDEE